MSAVLSFSQICFLVLQVEPKTDTISLLWTVFVSLLPKSVFYLISSSISGEKHCRITIIWWKLIGEDFGETVKVAVLLRGILRGVFLRKRIPNCCETKELLGGSQCFSPLIRVLVCGNHVSDTEFVSASMFYKVFCMLYGFCSNWFFCGIVVFFIGIFDFFWVRSVLFLFL